jgi:hypothetical protein
LAGTDNNVRSPFLLAWTERETIVDVGPLTEETGRRGGLEINEGGFRYCCQHCGFVEK